MGVSGKCFPEPKCEFSYPNHLKHMNVACWRSSSPKWHRKYSKALKQRTSFQCSKRLEVRHQVTIGEAFANRQLQSRIGLTLLQHQSHIASDTVDLAQETNGLLVKMVIEFVDVPFLKMVMFHDYVGLPVCINVCDCVSLSVGVSVWMYMCMYICLYIYMHIYMYQHVSTCIYST